MNIICSAAEALTATTQLVGTIIGSLSIIWSWASGLLHCAEGTIMNPIIATVCSGGSAFISGGANIIGSGLTQLLGGSCDTLRAAISGIIPK